MARSGLPQRDEEMKLPFFCIFFVSVGLTQVTAPEETIRDQRWPTAVQRTMVVSQSKFTDSKLEERFERILKSEGSKLKFLKVEVFVDRREATSGYCKCSTDMSY